MRNLVKIAVLATFAVVGFALSVNQSAWADLDDLFDQDKSQRDNAWRQMEEHKNKDQSKHKEPRRGFLNSAPPLPTILSPDENHTCACGTCSHPLQTYFSYLSIWVTDYDATWLDPDDKGAFTSMGSFVRAVGSEEWSDARDVWGYYYVCYGYGGPHDEKESVTHDCSVRVHDHVDEEWQLIWHGRASGGSETRAESSTETNTELRGGVGVTASGGAATGAPAAGSATGTATGSVSGSRKTHSRSATQSYSEGNYNFDWQRMKQYNCSEQPCGCGTLNRTTPPTPTPTVPTDESKRQPSEQSYVPSSTYVIQVDGDEFTPTNPLATYAIVSEDGARKPTRAGETVNLKKAAGVLVTVGTTTYLISNRRPGNTPLLSPQGVYDNVKVDQPMAFKTAANTNSVRLEGVTPQGVKTTIPTCELGKTEDGKIFATPQTQEIPPTELKVVEDDKPAGDVRGYVWVTSSGDKTEFRHERPGTKNLRFTRRGRGPAQTIEIRSSTPIESVKGG
ncbi:MAG: hypothetical protein RMK49_14750, partial [Abditibacteriales bacterium]|nr:hypothetical protein [Abditibacteriales bacterium]